jgi:hypothetical protein
MSTPSFQIGDVVTYETLDVESYSRGYGAQMETKASTIVAIRYVMANGDQIDPKKLVLVKAAESKSEQPKKD